MLGKVCRELFAAVVVGVLIEHRGLERLVTEAAHIFGHRRTDRRVCRAREPSQVMRAQIVAAHIFCRLLKNVLVEHTIIEMAPTARRNKEQ